MVQPHPDIGVQGHEPLQGGRQQIKRGRLTGADVQAAAVQRAIAVGEAPGQGVNGLHQLMDLGVELFAIRGQPNARAAPLEQGHRQIPLQCLDLQRHRGLGQAQALRRLGNAARLGGKTERPQLPQTVVTIGGRGVDDLGHGIAP